MTAGVARLSAASVVVAFDSPAEFTAPGASTTGVAWSAAAGGLALDASGLAAKSGA